LAALLVVALAAIIASGGFVASNMGFKLNYPLQAAEGAGCPGAGSCVSISGTQSFGLPYNRQVGIDSAEDLFKDLAASGFSMVGSNIQEFNIKADANDAYTFGFPDFPLTAGEGYLVQIQSTGDYIIVGSHDPGLSVSLQAQSGTGCPGAGTCVSISGTQRYSHPYHGVSATAQDLFLEIGGAVGENVQNFNIKADANDAYTFGFPDFALVPGRSYLIQVQSTRSFVPAHY
jgi:hypothetical protein